MRTLLILCCVVALLLIYSVSGLSQDGATPSAISSRIAELTPPDKDIPDNPIVLADEIRHINEELDETRKSAELLDRQGKALGKNKELATKTVQEIAGMNCDSPPGNLSALMDQLDRLARALADPFDENDDSPWAKISTQSIRSLDGKAQCEQLKALTSDPDLLSFIDKEQNEVEAVKAETNRLIKALQDRRGELFKHNQVAETQQNIFQYLWIIIGVIGLLSIGTIFTIKQFTPDIQQQWVASGQVIQFVTVMILLSVIMALGLASILKENTLGTLLGGIAGYVLSQGVGRAAAQAVKEGIIRSAQEQQAAAAPPPPVPLAIAAMNPNNGPSAGGTPVQITGTGFDSVTSVTFGGAAANINNQTGTTIDVTTPAGQAGAVDVVVTNQNGQAVTSAGGFTFA
jgi:hypothetical protein